jgi:hypothetical protein
MKQLQYYLCVVEKEIHIIDGSLSKSGYDSINVCKAILDLPDYGAPDQLYDVPDLDGYGKRKSSTGILEQTNEQQKSQIELFPNPAQNIIYIKTSYNNAITKIDLLDITGRLITSQKINTSSDIISLPIDVESGTYFIQITANNNIVRKKIVIIK